MSGLSHTGLARYAIWACLLPAASLGAGCGGGDSAGEQTTPKTAPADSTQGHENNDSSGDDESTEVTVSTELDFGQPFAEDPSFEGELGPMSVFITTDRSNLQQPEMDVELVHPGASPLEEVSLTLRFDVLESDVTPAPDQDLVLSVDQSQGECTEREESPSGSGLLCDLGTIEPAAKVAIHLVFSGPFRLRTTMGLSAR